MGFRAFWALSMAVMVFTSSCAQKQEDPDSQKVVEERAELRWAPQPPRNWKAEYDAGAGISPFDDPNQYIGSATAVQQMAYNVSRYRLGSLNYMFKKSGDRSYLQRGLREVTEMFGPDFFKDCHNATNCNGFDDGLKSWSWQVGTAPHFHGIARKAWTPFRITVKDVQEGSYCKTRFDIEIVDPAKPYRYTEESRIAVTCESGGTIALYSSWAKTGYRKLKILPVVPTVPAVPIYDLESRLPEFSSDWVRMTNEDPRFVNDTGTWTLNESGEIHSDATLNDGEGFYYPYPSGSVDNHGIASQGAASGKVSVLVLDPQALFPGLPQAEAQDKLRNYVVEGEIFLDKRNWAWAENAVGVRVNSDSPTQLFQGHRVKDALPGANAYAHPTERNRWGGYDAGSRNVHFEPYPRAFKTSFGTVSMISYREGTFLGGPNQSRGNLSTVNLESEYLPYEGGSAQGSLEWARLVYEAVLKNGSADTIENQRLLDAADHAVIQFQTQILPKFYLGEQRYDPEFALGENAGQNYDGEAKRLYGDYNRGPLLHLQLYKISKQFPERWRALTQANPWRIRGELVDTPSPEKLQEYFQRIVMNNVNNILYMSWIHPGTGGAAQWFNHRHSFWGEFTTWGSDLQHNGLNFYLLTEAVDLGLLAPEKLEPFAKTFTNVIWNGKTQIWDGLWSSLGLPAGHNLLNDPMANTSLIDLSVDIHGSGSATLGQNLNSAQMCDYWALLARSDFKVYEILNTWMQGAWEGYKNWHSNASFFRIQPALLYYMVKFGTPKHFTASAAGNAGTPGIQLQWNHPSDWPGGTTLKNYRIHRLTISAAVEKQEEVVISVPTSVTSYRDLNVIPGASYEYRITAQDHSTGVNESDPTPAVRVDLR